MDDSIEIAVEDRKETAMEAPIANAQSDEHAEPARPQADREYKVYPGRFYVLITFALLAGQQALSWMTFGTIPNESYTHFGLTDDDVTLLSGKTSLIARAHAKM